MPLIKIITSDNKIINTDERLLKRCVTYCNYIEDNKNSEEFIINFMKEEYEKFDNFLMNERFSTISPTKEELLLIIRIADYLEYEGYISKDKMDMFEYFIKYIAKQLEIEDMDMIYKYCEEKDKNILEWKSLEEIIGEKTEIKNFMNEEENKSWKKEKKLINFYQNEDVEENLLNDQKNDYSMLKNIVGKVGPVYINSGIHEHSSYSWDNLSPMMNEKTKKKGSQKDEKPTKKSQMHELLIETDHIIVGCKNKKITMKDIEKFYYEVNNLKGCSGRSYYYERLHKETNIENYYYIAWGS